MTTKPKAPSRAASLTAVRKAQARLTDLETKADDAATARNQAVLVASDAGNSRADLQEATGVSQSRITQILRRARNQS
jgi:hypothetical protein